MAQEPDEVALNSQKATLLDSAPLCAAVLDAQGKAKVVNKVFVELMGPLFKFSNYEFAEAASKDEGKASLKAAISAVFSGASPRERLRNIEMLTLAGESGLPVKTHFDWFIGPSKDPGEVTLYGDPCSDEILEQREKDAELIDFFQNAPIALHWLSGTGHVMWANQTELDVLGYTAEEYIGQPIMKFCPDEEELVLEIFKTLGSGNIIKDVPVRFRTKSGKIVPLLIDSNVAYKVDEKGEKAFNHTRCFIRDDTGRRVREARTESLLKEAERSLKMLDGFVSRTLHLIKTPCHIAQQSLGLINARVLDLAARLPEAEQRWVDGTRTLLDGSMQQLAEVTDLVTDASDVMRFEQGAVMQMVPTELPLLAVGRAVCGRAATLCKKRVAVTFNFAAGPSVVKLDSRVIHRALSHLLANAAEATPAGGAITLRVTHAVGYAAPAEGEVGGAPEPRVCFEVHDTGRGLPDGGSSAIFQRYSPGISPINSPESHGAADAVEKARLGMEASLSFNNAKKGLGIGLNLTYGLVRSLGGELRFRSKEGGGDTAFSFEVPAVAASAPAPAEAIECGIAPETRAAAPGWAQSRRCNWDSIASSPEADVSKTSANPPAAVLSPSQDSTGSTVAVENLELASRAFVEEKPWKKVIEASCVAGTGLKAMDKPHVLVVEDTTMCADVLRVMLKQLGCSSDHAEHGEQALEQLMFSEPGLHTLVLMDLRMNVMDGFNAAMAIKKMGIDVPIIAVTADGSQETRARCKEIGFDDFTTKPLLAETLAALLEKHTGHKLEAVK